VFCSEDHLEGEIDFDFLSSPHAPTIKLNIILFCQQVALVWIKKKSVDFFEDFSPYGSYKIKYIAFLLSSSPLASQL